MTATRVLRLAFGSLGVAVLAYGVRGLLTERAISDRAAVGEWLIGGVIAHDALLAPIVYLLSAVAYRFAGARSRGRLAALLLTGGSLVLISIPALLRKGLNRNQTVLPLDYSRNLGVLLAVLAAAIAVYSGIDALRRRTAIRHTSAAAVREAAATAATEEATVQVEAAPGVAREVAPAVAPDDEPGAGQAPGEGLDTGPEAPAAADNEPAGDAPGDPGDPGDEEVRET